MYQLTYMFKLAIMQTPVNASSLIHLCVDKSLFYFVFYDILTLAFSIVQLLAHHLSDGRSIHIRVLHSP